MNNFPETAGKIAADYLQRVKSQLRLIPAREQDEFLREIQSHLYEAYQQTEGDDEVARILAVLRNLGEPAEVVSDRLPAAMVRSGIKRILPLHLLGGILIALFGIPLGFGGVVVLAGILVTLVEIVVVYYATTGLALLTGTFCLLLGLSRIYDPQLLDRLRVSGAIHLNLKLAYVLDQFTPASQGVLLLVLAGVFFAAGLGMLWLGKYLIRGLRFLFSLVFDWLRKFAQSARRRLQANRSDAPRASGVSFAPGNSGM